jgi:hypothetical protein
VLESWRDRLGPERFDTLWSILQEITSETDPLPDLTEIRRSRGKGRSTR